MSKIVKCWLALQRTKYGVPLDIYICHITKKDCGICTSKYKVRSCKVWRQYKERGVPVAL